MGRRERRHWGFATEGAILFDADRVREGDHAGQAGYEEHVRMSGLQDENARSHLRVDVQFQEPRQAEQVDPGRCRDSPADLTRCSPRPRSDGSRCALSFLSQRFPLGERLLLHVNTLHRRPANYAM